MKLDFLVELLSGTIAQAGESKLVEVLQDLHDSNLADYKAAIAGGKALVQHLEPLVKKSKTKIDDLVISAIGDAIDLSASSNEISFNNDGSIAESVSSVTQ